MIYDTHSHLNFPVFEEDREKVIKECLKERIGIINVGTNLETSKVAVEIAQKYERGVCAAVGLHPINLDTGLVKLKVDEKEGKHFEKEFNEKAYKELAKNEKVVAIGEIGLDFYWRPKTTKKKEIFKQKQKDLFLRQLNLALQLNLPIILHCRLAHSELLEILSSMIEDRKLSLKGVIHGFVGKLKELKRYLELGFYVGFNGIIFKEIEGIDFKSLIQQVPLEKILVETDCPYLSRPGYKERNDPLGVKMVIEEIAIIKNLTFEEVAKQTSENAKRLFFEKNFL